MFFVFEFLQFKFAGAAAFRAVSAVVRFICGAGCWGGVCGRVGGDEASRARRWAGREDAERVYNYPTHSRLYGPGPYGEGVSPVSLASGTF